MKPRLDHALFESANGSVENWWHLPVHHTFPTLENLLNSMEQKKGMVKPWLLNIC